MTSLAIFMICLAYLAGSLSSAIIVCQIANLPDPRQVGSKNPGATNVFRIGGRFPAACVLLFDILKGTIPVYSSYWLDLPPVVLGLVGVAACIGHIYPLYFGFKGGKAVATAFGALLPLGLPVAGSLIATWALVVFVTGYSSLGAVVSVSLAPLFTWLFKPEYIISVAMLSVLIIWRHRLNILRLFKGEEPSVWSGLITFRGHFTNKSK